MLSFHLGSAVVVLGSGKPMPDSDHEEADTWICPHVLDALEKGCRIIQVRTVDTDVVVILIGVCVWSC